MTSAAGTPEPVAVRVRRFAWSLRRELWEHRSLTAAPLAAAVVVLVAFVLGSARLAGRVRAAAASPPGQQPSLTVPFDLAASLILLVTFAVGAFYCLDALHAERRDRSILFWKSLPVSDGASVLAKAGIPLFVLPLWGFAVVVAAQLVILLVGVLASLRSGTDPTPLLAPSAWFRAPRVAYGVAVHALWHAPLYAWLLLASAWARRMPLLWAVLPPLGLGVFERVAFGTTHAVALLRWRLTGALPEAFDLAAPDGFGLRPVAFLVSPGLWAGLLCASLFLAAAIRLRRAREPL